MKIKFAAGPAATIASVSFGSFDGVKRHCVRYKTAKGGVKRCADYKEGKGHPTCAGISRKNTRSTGNSKFPMLRTRPCGPGTKAGTKKRKSGGKRKAKR